MIDNAQTWVTSVMEGPYGDTVLLTIIAIALAAVVAVIVIHRRKPPVPVLTAADEASAAVAMARHAMANTAAKAKDLRDALRKMGDNDPDFDYDALHKGDHDGNERELAAQTVDHAVQVAQETPAIFHDVARDLKMRTITITVPDNVATALEGLANQSAQAATDPKFPRIVAIGASNIMLKAPIHAQWRPDRLLYQPDPSNGDGTPTQPLRSPAGFPLSYTKAADGAVVGTPSVLYLGHAFNSDAEVLEFIRRAQDAAQGGEPKK